MRGVHDTVSTCLSSSGAFEAGEHAPQLESALVLGDSHSHSHAPLAAQAFALLRLHDHLGVDLVSRALDLVERAGSAHGRATLTKYEVLASTSFHVDA